jgi:hypothetical protein
MSDISVHNAKQERKRNRREQQQKLNLPGYVQNGTHQLPLFQGEPSLSVLERMECNTFNSVVTGDQSKRKEAQKIKLMKSKSSIVVKLWDCQLDPRDGDDVRTKCSLDNFDEVQFRSGLLKSNASSSPWTVSMAEIDRESASNPLSSALPKGLDEDAYDTKARAAMLRRWC